MSDNDNTKTVSRELPVFIDRRSGRDRRHDDDPCQDLPIDLYHRKRRKSPDRRKPRSLMEDYYAFLEAQGFKVSKRDEMH